MRIKLCCQTIVTVIVLRVASLLHGAQKHHGQDIFVRLVFDRLHNILQSLLTHRASRPVYPYPKARGVVDKLLHLLRLRLLVNPIDKGQIQLSKMLSHRLIGHQHKGLNHALGNSPLTQDNIHRPTFFIDHDFGFTGVKVKRTAFKAHVFQNLMQLDHAVNTRHNGFELLGLFLVPSDDVVDITIGHAKGRLDDCLRNGMLDHAPLGIYLHDSGLGQPIHIRIKGADTV